jgi:hypothetical protein
LNGSSGTFDPTWNFSGAPQVTALTVAFKSTSGVPLLVAQTVGYVASPLAFTPQAAGNLLIVLASSNVGGAQGARITGITDNATGGSNLYTQCLNAQVDESTLGETFDIWYAKNIKKTGVTTITPAYSPGAYGFGSVYEISGADLLVPFDVAIGAALQSSTGANLCPNPSLITNYQQEIIVAIKDNSGSFPSPYVQDGTGIPYRTTTVGTCGSSLIVISSGTYQAVWVASGSGVDYGGSLASFVIAGGISGPTAIGQQGYGAAIQDDQVWLGGDTE